MEYHKISEVTIDNEALESSTPDEVIQDALVKVFKEAGWNPDTMNLDPRKLKISSNTYHKIIDAFKAVPGVDQEWVGMFGVNYMPSVDDSIADDMIGICDGAFECYE